MTLYIKRKTLIFAAWLMLISLSSSCKKYLDQKSDSQLVVPRTLNDFQALLDDALTNNLNVTPSYGETSADDYFLPPETYNQLFDGEAKIYTWRRGEYNFPNDWSYGYLVVYNSNSCLDGISAISRSPQNGLQWDNVKGSALFFRAYYFNALAEEYALAYDAATAQTDLGIPLRLQSDPFVPSVRASVEETYRRILTDTKEAAAYLPNTPQQVLRPSKAAAYGLLARVYLSMNMYDSAAKYAGQCLAIKNTLLDYNNPADVFIKYNAETIFYSDMNFDLALISPYEGMADTTLVSSYQPGDLRKDFFFTAVDNYYTFTGTYAGDQNSHFTGLATDEVWLIGAEAAARLGNTDEAMADLNLLREKRFSTGSFVPLTAATSAEALELVLTERRKELIMRGRRWIDIKRLNKAGGNIIPTRLVNGQLVTLPVNDRRYALPLPADIIKATGMQQN